MSGKSSGARRQQRRRNKAAPPTCPYCGKPAAYTPTSGEVYHGHDYGPLWICRPCLAWVGTHKGTRQPLGRLANSELRKAKIAAHAVFDPLWQSGEMTRNEAYHWLADALGLPEPPHMGEMDLELCQRVIAACVNYEPTESDPAGGWSGNESVEPGDPDDCPFDSYDFTADAE